APWLSRGTRRPRRAPRGRARARALPAMFQSGPRLVRKMFLPFYSKERGPPKIRQQVAGTRGRRFFKVVACNQRDPQQGKHMEVLGSYAPKVRTGVKEIRLRFSRIKFWLGVGAEFNAGTRQLLALSGLIPTPPPLFGRRTKARVFCAFARGSRGRTGLGRRSIVPGRSEALWS
ncbi:unnamed protein product, partial [Prorocentrum cordatum]